FALSRPTGATLAMEGRFCRSRLRPFHGPSDAAELVRARRLQATGCTSPEPLARVKERIQSSLFPKPLVERFGVRADAAPHPYFPARGLDRRGCKPGPRGPENERLRSFLECLVGVKQRIRIENLRKQRHAHRPRHALRQSGPRKEEAGEPALVRRRG